METEPQTYAHWCVQVLFQSATAEMFMRNAPIAGDAAKDGCTASAARGWLTIDLARPIELIDACGNFLRACQPA
jgi:hypothetical protein